MSAGDFRIALYYCYIEIQSVTHHITLHKELCQKLGLRGRIRISPEGINGVLSGLYGDLQSYEAAVRESLQEIATDFELDVKYCELRSDLPPEAQLFPELRVMETKTVISLVDMEASMKPSKKKAPAPVHVAQEIFQRGLTTYKPAKHLNPHEWDAQLAQAKDRNVVFLDCRNVYESNVGHFRAPQATTILTNTRKYPELPVALLSQKDRLRQSDEIYMYCTGGVRCERASVFLQALLEDESDSSKTPAIYQLHGGIQRYLETQNQGLYRGKNFVFDPRRTDPHSNDQVLGQCLLCGADHDDYDNGSAPADNQEARCCQCRILVLVCDACRTRVICWGETGDHPKLYCGKDVCMHTPPVQILE